MPSHIYHHAILPWKYTVVMIRVPTPSFFRFFVSFLSSAQSQWAQHLAHLHLTRPTKYTETLIFINRIFKLKWWSFIQKPVVGRATAVAYNFISQRAAWVSFFLSLHHSPSRFTTCSIYLNCECVWCSVARFTWLDIEFSSSETFFWQWNWFFVVHCTCCC